MNLPPRNWLTPLTLPIHGKPGRPPIVDEVMKARIRQLSTLMPRTAVAELLGLDRGTVARYL